MDLVFGLYADGGASPDHAGDAGGALGKPVLGPAGLADLLETALGIGGPLKGHVVRVAAFQSILEGLEGSYFWSRSLGMDPWATARTLLGWRDELIGIGWNPDAQWTEPRLSDLATASRAATGVPSGLSDRIDAILRTLDARASAPVSRIRLIDSLAAHPSPLRRLFLRLKDMGCEVSEIEARAAAPETTSLGKLQRWMLGSTAPIEGGADGSITVMTSSSQPLAAEVLGQWFSVQSQAGISIVAQDGDTDLLDHGLASFAQPRAGRSRASVHRGSLQLLLLAFKVSWTPFDPRDLMEILVFPGSPVAPRAAWRLASALESAPGRGGAEWAAAWAAITNAEYADADGDTAKMAAVEPRLNRWRAWAEPEAAEPLDGMPLNLALSICDRVTMWAGRRFAHTEDPLFAATAKLAGEVRLALVALDRERLPRLLVERVIDQALDVGHLNPGSVAQAANWRSTSHPGAVWAPAPAVVWWNFGSTSEGTVRSPWSEAERSELARAGCPADDLTTAARAVSSAWERAILNARETVLLVASGLDCENDDQLHPLAHRIKPAFEQVGTRVKIEAALAMPELIVAGTRLVREAVTTKALPVQRFAWPTPDGFAARLEQVTESATSLESLFSCQLMWALRHVAKLRPGVVRSIPDANQLLGNLAHAIAREILQPGNPPPPDDAAQKTRALLEGRIDQLAAPLRQPQLAEELNFARRRLPAAMASLAQCLADNGLRVEATEQQVSGTFETLLALRGAVDLIARDPRGHAVIIDLKWTRSDKSRVQEISTGRAVQLATYGALVAGTEPYRAGYFMLNQRQFATLAGSGLVGREVDGTRTFPETWTAILAAWRTWRDVAASGSLLATGVEGVADHLPAALAIDREVRCDRCDYSTLCRMATA